MPMLKIGFLINPFAGIGGPLAYKGSDHIPLDAKVELAQGRPAERAAHALSLLTSFESNCRFYTLAGAMGADCLSKLPFAFETVFEPTVPSTADDTKNGLKALLAAGIELLVFVGGDGTARDVFSIVGSQVPVLGIPAGVKMHSAVFAINPQAAGHVLTLLLSGQVVALTDAEVRDIDESELREGRVKARYYGELRVPFDPRFVQQMKCSGPDNEELVQEDIAAEFIENADPDITYILGPGSTTKAIMRALGFEKTLLGFDAVKAGALMKQDLDAQRIEDLLNETEVKAVITATPQQGILLGRGNQQLTPHILRRLTKQGLVVVATPQKLSALDGRPLLVDTGDSELDQELSGIIEVISGYQMRSLYRIGTHG